jgi:hypothetical protein
MRQHIFVFNPALETALLVLQGIVVAFLLLHDWIPLGRLNNLAAIQRQDTFQHRVIVTLLPGVPAALGLIGSLRHYGEPYPDSLEILLWITYGVLLAGLLRAWWIPYLFGTDAKRAARYRIIFAGTHRFLPARNGFAPDTLHTLFHAATIATLVALFLRDRIMSFGS